ncbi:hypothetical protein ACLB2K_073386 [Fragaria x ananassa]
MKRVASRKEKMSKVIDPICPKPREILEKNKVKSTTNCIPSGTGSPMIEVDSIRGGTYVVDLQRRKCACRRWDLTGIPCKHVVSVINFMRQKPEHSDMWMPTNEQAILPPPYNRQPEKGTKPPPKTKNELRTKAQLRKAAAKDKRYEKRVAEKAVAKAASKGPPTRGRPPKSTTSTVRNASANAQPSQPSQASSRSSVRI